jgi:4-hydroxybenzoate polyprenyltransferase
MAFAAQTGEIPLIAWLLFVINILWTVVYDTLYAIVDREDDLLIGVKSTAVLFGKADKVIVASLQLIVIILLLYLGMLLSYTYLYYMGIFIAALLAIYQQWLIKDREPAKCFQAFLNNHWFGMAVFVGIAGHYYT